MTQILSSRQAKRLVTRYFMDHVNMFIHPDEPTLLEVKQLTVWRFPMIYSLGTFGRLGTVGTVDVNVNDGQLSLNRQQIETMQRKADSLAAQVQV